VAVPASGLQRCFYQFLHRCKRLIEFADVASAGLRHVGPPAAAAAHALRHLSDQVAGMDTARVVVLETLARLESPNVDLTKLEAAIGYDVALGYKLLRLVNSSAYALSSPVSSLRQAIAVLGLNQLRGWMTLLLLSRMGNKPNELAMTALVRARLAEKIAAALALKPVESYFLTGLFSVLDAFLDRPMQEAVQGMPISAEIRDALVTRAGALGEVLNAIMQLEQGDWQPCLNLGMRGDQLNEAFVAAVEYAGVLAKQLES